MADVPNRDARERELAAAILILWLLFEDLDLRTKATRAAFELAFTERVQPLLVRIYSRARQQVATEFGHTYTPAPAPEMDGMPTRRNGESYEMPGISNRIRKFYRDLLESFRGRQSDKRRADKKGDPFVPMTEDDAGMISVTMTTEAHSTGEVDGAEDVFDGAGVEVEAVWVTEPGACPRCSPLEGASESVWKRQYPSGPPVHPRCRCSLRWRVKA